MSRRLEGKVALVTGAARGIGRAVARRFAEEGADIVLLDIARDVPGVPYPGARQQQLDEAVAEVRKLGRQAMAHVADVTDGRTLSDAVAQAQKQFGHIDLLVTAAGIDSWGAAWELTDDQWQKMIDVNLSGVWKTAKAVAPVMIAQGQGAMVFIGSVLSHRANKSFAHYTAAKHGVLGLMRSFGLELAQHRIRVNSVDPTVVFTDMVMNQAYLDRLGGHPGTTLEEAKAYYRNWNTLPVPWIEPEDVANACLFLASEEARYITGVALPVDLGAMLK
ncbi:MAG TPA: mycofactocin-coupled SDR family oxidoreductase [Dongiaceae bacterium]|jgi:(+)-trans-carveol dehydrogenase|nr:mycofactocin-coupled SDR family oxidoreductase [Dongiaceae bacterium]